MIFFLNPKSRPIIKALEKTFCLMVLLFSVMTMSFAQELDIVGNGGNTFALRNDVGSTSTIWQSFWPEEGVSYKAFLQSHTSGRFDIGAIGGDIQFYSGSNYNMYLTSDGLLGLGTSAPGGKMEIVHNSSSGLAGVPHIDIHESSASDFARIKFTSNSSDFWTLAGAGGATDAFNLFYHDGTTGTNRISVDATDGTTIFGAENDGIIAALKITAGAQNMLIDGNEMDSDNHLRLNFNSGFDVNLRTSEDRADVNMEHQSSSGSVYGFAIENEGANNNYWTMYTVNANGDFELYNNGVKRGDFDAISGAYTSVSDRDRKRDIRAFNDVLGKVMQIEPSIYKFKGDSTNQDHIGFIAQDIESFFPEVVKKGRVGDTEEELYTMDYSALGVIAIEAVQEQQVLIEAQKGEIAELRSIVDQLVARVSALEN